MAVEVGDVAPEISLPDQDRAPRTLSEFKGKNVLIAFYPGAFTGGCTKEVCSLRDNMARLNDSNAQVLGISIDAPGAQKAFAEANQLNFPLLSDYKRDATKAYGVEFNDFLGMEGFTASRRAVFVVNPEGKVSYKWMASGDPIPPYDEIDAALASA